MVLKDGKSKAFYDAIIVTMNQQEVSKRMLDAGYWLQVLGYWIGCWSLEGRC